MNRLDDLPPDQRATLSLILTQGKHYAEVAALLDIGEGAVHDRAHAALAVLAPREARELSAERREEIGDYLLGQRDGLGERMRTRSLLDGSPAAQAWARALAAELAPLSPAGLPEIPDGAGPAEQGDARGGPDGGERAGPGRPQLPSSRVGGAILLAVIAAVVVAVVLLTTGGGSSHRRQGASATQGGATSTSTTPRATETKRLALAPPGGASANKPLGVAAVLQEGSTYAFYLAAERLPPSTGFFYAVWLYNSPTSFEALSKSPAVGSDGRLQGGSLLPADASRFHQMLVTRETSERPSRPGPFVLSGSFGLR
jgi:Sigma-70, region 4